MTKMYKKKSNAVNNENVHNGLILNFSCDDGVTYEVESMDSAYDFFNQRDVDCTGSEKNNTNEEVATKVFRHFIMGNQLWLSDIFDVDLLSVMTFEFTGVIHRTKSFCSTEELLAYFHGILPHETANTNHQ